MPIMIILYSQVKQIYYNNTITALHHINGKKECMGLVF